MREIAVIILNYNTWKDTIKEVESVIYTCDVKPQDIYVIDNASTNDSVFQLELYSKNRFNLIISNKNNGYAAGNNIGLRLAYKKGYKYAWILNNDIIIQDKNIIKKNITILKNHNDVACVSPDIYTPNGYIFNRDSIRPNFWDFTFGMLAYKKKGRKIFLKENFGYVYRPQGCCMFLNLEYLNKVDYFDEHTFLYCEEIILAERLLNLGYKCACNVNSSVIHNHSKTVKNTFQKKEIIKIKESSFDYYLSKYRNYNIISRKIVVLFDIIKWNILKN